MIRTFLAVWLLGFATWGFVAWFEAPSFSTLQATDARALHGGAVCENQGDTYFCNECDYDDRKCDVEGNIYSCVPWSGAYMECWLTDVKDCGGLEYQFDSGSSCTTGGTFLDACTRDKNKIVTTGGSGQCP